MSLKHLVVDGQISSKTTRKILANIFYEVLWDCHYAQNKLLATQPYIQDRGLSIGGSAEYVTTGYINDRSTIDQRWINNW